jgi:hypothetical protein
MPRLDRRFLLCALASAILFGLLLLPWPGLGVRFTRAFCAAADFIAGGIRFHDVLGIAFEPASATAAGAADPSEWSAALLIRSTEATSRTVVSVLHLRPLAYAPLCVFVALTLGAPARAPRIWAQSAILGLVLTLLTLVLFTATATTWLLAQVYVAGADHEALTLLAGQRTPLIELSGPTGWVLGMLNGFTNSMACEVVCVVWAASRWFAARACLAAPPFPQDGLRTRP